MTVSRILSNQNTEKNKTSRFNELSANTTVSENARLGTTSPPVDDDLDLWDHSGFMLRSDFNHHNNNQSKCGSHGWCRPSCIPITIILILIVLVVLLPLIDHQDQKNNNNNSSEFGSDFMCMNSCKISLTESIPIGMIYDKNKVLHKSTYQTWIDLINSAEDKIEIASFYWTMNRKDVYPDDSAKYGEDVFAALLEAGRDRGIKLKIAQSIPSQISPNIDTEYLAKKANAKVRNLNFVGLFGSGVLHTKLWLVDRTHVYIGSANMDWRSLTQVKELGIVAFNCSCLAKDISKIFDVYWKIGGDGKIPVKWPDSLSTKVNVDNPMKFNLDQNSYSSFISSSPGPLSPKGRTNDIDAILNCIDKAEKFIYISVMDFFPLTIYTPKTKFWPIIDNALRSAAINRKVTVRLLISWWKHSRKSEDNFLKSLVDLTDSYENVKIEAKRFIVPTNSSYDKIPFGRVNHNKYMVTDIAAYIGTSNWSGDYFIDTAGVGIIFEDVGDKNNNSIRQQLEELFLRDWNSPYAFSLNATCNNPIDEQFRSKISYFLPFHGHHIRA
ncbi:5'-3' exonuclease PLD3-like isoform X2 [Aphidius gifuensis]|uniref:5'-3' exonuclease PLD3-like isoform X2 n=1 Tax=Aphidius gifuensis TaxID=684658 RepID=UPI001CDBC48E|nr:5'-3' exonuclease PLD3-like isoform X2 [Aphidius gifuensis]